MGKFLSKVPHCSVHLLYVILFQIRGPCLNMYRLLYTVNCIVTFLLYIQLFKENPFLVLDITFHCIFGLTIK